MSHEHSPGSSIETQIHQSISGIPYPSSKEEIIEYARSKSGNDGVIDLLNKLPPLEYLNEPHVLSTLKEYVDS
jgi:hypothetical protein